VRIANERPPLPPPRPLTLSRLPSWSTLPLLRHFISARVGFLARVSELGIHLPTFLDFDAKIDAAITSLVGISPREAASYHWIPILRSLLLSLNGLGIPRFAGGLAGETACLLSRDHCYEFFEEYYPPLLRSTRDQWPAI
jgi:hypothetical protein